MNLRHLIVNLILICFLVACSKQVSTSTVEPTISFTLTKSVVPTVSSTFTKTVIPFTSTPSPTKNMGEELVTRHERITSTPIGNQTLLPSPTGNSLPTVNITSTSTPQPPLISHTWKLNNILVQVEGTGGDGCCWNVDPPELVLYGDGLLIRSKIIKGRYEMMARKLNRREMCALFNTLDQVGFLDYDRSVYMDPMDGLPNTFITVNIWKKQQIYGQVLDKWIYEGGDWWRKECSSEDCLPPPVILPALSNAYKLLKQYDPGGLKKLPIQQMVIWAIPEEREYEPKPWPIKEISLKEIVQRANEENSFTVFINDPAIVRALQEKAQSGYYVEGDVRRYIDVRPLWPAETHFGMSFPVLPTASSVVPSGTTLTCNPEDGLLPVP